MADNKTELHTALSYCYSMAAQFDRRHPGTETPWDILPLCPGCGHRLTREDIQIPIADYMQKLHDATAHLVSDRMRPMVRAILGHQEQCPTQCERSEF